jgi:hypothetical protein
MSRGLVNNMLTMNNLGDGSTLSLDFTTMGGVLDPRLTFTRASTVATYVNSSGYVATATTNEPRFDYSPTNIGAPRGLLVEGQTPNITLYSEKLNQSVSSLPWYYGNLNTPTVATGIADPYGNTTGTTAWKLVASGAGDVYHAARQTWAFTAAAYTFSFYAKAAEYDRVTIGDLTSGQGGCSFVLTGNGTATVRGSGTNPQITPYGTTGWYRCSFTMTMTATSVGMGIVGYPVATTPNAFGASYVADGSSGVYVTMVQVELGSGASSYIPTGASTVTRNADGVVMNEISSLNYSTTNGSMVYEGRFSKINISSYPTRMGFLTAGGEPAFEIYANGTTIFSGIKSVSVTNEVLRTIAINTDYKFATSFNAASSSQVRCSLNGAAAVGSGTSAITATRTPTVFGFTRIGYELYFPSGTIKTAKYWNTTLTDADLVSKST